MNVVAPARAVRRPTRRQIDDLGRALRQIEEPTALRNKLRLLAGSDSARAREEVVRLLAGFLWRKWRPELIARPELLARSGIDPALATPRGLRTVLAGDVRELWLWVMGDRPFVQVLDGVTGRYLRRLIP